MMIKLSDRLQMIASLVEVGQTVADIGTDHGFLPVFLWESKKSPKVILADISKGSLQKAIDNVAAQGYDRQDLKDGFDFRLGNGIQVLENNQVDAVVIAGMGGILMTEILGEDIVKTKSFKKIILQPRNGQGRLRWWLLNNGFRIISENLVREGRFICEIIAIEPENIELNPVKLPKDDDNQVIKQYEDIQYEIPESLLIGNGTLAIEFIEKKLKIEEKILDDIKKSKNYDEEKIFQLQKRIKYLKELLGKYTN